MNKLSFPNETQILSYLESHLAIGESENVWLKESNALEVIAKLFGNSTKDSARIESSVTFILNELEDKITLPESKLLQIKIDLTTALKDCAQGNLLKIGKGVNKQESAKASTESTIPKASTESTIRLSDVTTLPVNLKEKNIQPLQNSDISEELRENIFAPSIANIPVTIPEKSQIITTPPEIEIITIDKLRQEPVKSYETLRKRLNDYGNTAPFPEFAPVVQHLENELNNEEILEYIEKNPLAKMHHKLIQMELFSLKFIFKVEDKDYPHKTSNGPYPYIPTINAIRRSVEFFDNFIRSNYENVPPYYHADRYLYHYNHVYNSNFIYFPTIDELTLNDFLLTRSAPIGFLGVSTKPVFADGYYNSPLDFFMHDFNHVRRFKSYNDMYESTHQIEEKDMLEFFHNYTLNHILPNIEITNDIPEKERYIRQILAVLYFELVHEYAFTPDTESFKRAFQHKPGDPSPFEHMIESRFNPAELEKLRLPNNNLLSGYSTWNQNDNYPIIRYFFDKGPNFLTSAYNKCINGFYDTHFARSKDLPPHDKRTVELFFETAKRFLSLHNMSDILSDEELKNLLKLEGPLEKYPNTNLVEPESKT